ncbi:hypothetical protein [Paracoccus aestuarii]|nr:hypothetical protein [Paracoccus aestuarii]WCQ99097.1 hypothetical protein JHW48_14870 [Paracoccus aestuarii]
MARKSTKRIYGTTGHPMQEAAPLGIAFVVGVGGCIALKFLPLHPLFGAIFAGLVLVAYALYTYNATSLRLDSETIGDNCYYLGFLFTLTSLAVTLYFVIEAPSERRADMIPEIIAGFGVALSSTIFGVFLRVLMMQFKIDMDSRERHERQALNDASRRFRTELGMSLDQVKTFSVESLQQNVEREKRMREAFDTLLSDMQQELLKSAQEFGPALRESVRIQTEASLDLVTKAVKDSSAVAAEGIRKAVEEMSATATELTGHNVEAAERIRKSVSTIVAAAESLSTDVAHTSATLARAQEVVSDFTTRFEQEIESGSKTMAGALETAGKAIEGGAHIFTVATERSGEAIQTSADRIKQNLESSAAKLGEAGDRLAGRLDAEGSTPGIVVPGPGANADRDEDGATQAGPAEAPESKTWRWGRRT